MIFKSKRNW